MLQRQVTAQTTTEADRWTAEQSEAPLPQRPAHWVQGALDFQFEALKDILPELSPLIVAHFKEVDVPLLNLDPNMPNLLFFAAGNRYFVATARTKQGSLVGYCCGWVVNTLIDQKAKVLCINAIYLDPLYREGPGPSDKFMEMMEQVAREEECLRMEMAPQGANAERMGKWLMRRYGFIHSPEPCYWKEFV